MTPRGSVGRHAYPEQQRPADEVAAGRPAQPRGAYLAWPAFPADTGRHVLTVLFWLGLAVALLQWWRDTAAGSIVGVAEVMTAAGRITGMLGGYLLLIQILLMSRIRWLERWIGANLLLSRHRELGGSLVVLVLAHVVFITFGYAGSHETSILSETWTLLTTYQDMISAFVATGILVGIGVLAIRAIRRVMPYEIWYYLHLSSYAVLLFAYGHQFANGEQVYSAGFGQEYWRVLHLGVVACMIQGRLVAPFWLNWKHRLRVAKVVAESPDIFSIYVTGRRLEDLEAKAGQFFRWRFLAPGCWGQAHPFSLSAAPNGRWLRLTIRAVGDHTKKLSRLRRGVRVYVEGPSGVFTADRGARHGALLIAAGSGIAPIRALLEELPPGAIVIYRASTRDELVFREELNWLAKARDAEVMYVVGSRDDPGPGRLFTARGLRQLIPDVTRRDVYVCGPEGLVSAATRTLKRLRVPDRQIHIDQFEF